MADDHRPLTVLIVDDELDVRVLVRAILVTAKAGIEVVGEAVDGTEALAELERLDAPPVPTVVILDNRMPGIEGIDVAAEIRRRLPVQHIVLFTSYVTKELQERARSLGVDACVSKEQILRLPEIVLDLTTTVA